jgi:hypothetical protein
LSHEDIAVMKHAAEKAALVINAQTEANKSWTFMKVYFLVLIG